MTDQTDKSENMLDNQFFTPKTTGQEESASVVSLDFSTVIASSVHDMKNSLSMLLYTLDEIAGQCDPIECPASAKFLQLQYEGQRVNNHLIQLLTIYKMGNSQCATNFTEQYLDDFLDECALQYEGLLTPKGIDIESNCEAGLVSYFDRELVAGVVNNVINNAYRYSRNKIRLSGKQEDGYVVISIKDNGAGYPPAMLCDSSRGVSGVNFSTGSTGLGLYFSSLVAEAHENQGRKGFIRCTNDGIEGGGCFSIYIP